MNFMSKEQLEYITTSMLLDKTTLASQGIDSGLWEKYLHRSKGKMIKQRGDYVVKIGQTLDGIYYFKAGRMVSNLLGKEGLIKTISIVGAGCSFGDQFIFHNQPSLFEGVILEESELYFFDKQTVLDILRQDFEFSLMLFKMQALRSRKLAVQIEDMSLRSITQNLCRILYTLCCYTEKNDDISIELSHQDLANMLASHRVTVSKNMKILKEQGIIDYKYEKIIIKNRMELKRIAFE